VSGPADKGDRPGPYKGLDSFQPEDAVIFFGRDREAEQVTGEVLSSRCMLLHAQSGAGKTSLLNARVIPELERRGWTPVRILLQDNPVRSTRLTTLQYVLPPPQAEQSAIGRAVEALTDPGEDPVLEELVDRFDRLKVDDPRRRALVAPVEVDAPARAGGLGAGAGMVGVTPYVCRVLRSTLEARQFFEHLEAVSADPGVSDRLRGLGCRELTRWLGDEYLRPYQELAEDLDPPVPGLRPFFENLLECYARLEVALKFVLIFDQFEEIFTRFVDAGPVAAPRETAAPSWRLRWEFFEELEGLLGGPESREGSASAGSGDRGLPPILYVFSMRSEYIAQMDPVRRVALDLVRKAYRLELLDVRQAGEAIRRPAALFGYDYSDGCYNAIVGQLTKEERFIEPSHLQIVCLRLWNERGLELVSGPRPDSSTVPAIQLDTLEALGGARGILKAFLDRYLSGLKDDDRLETLEMLGMLITTGNTRNIVGRDQVVNAPYRLADRRERLLDGLVNRGIVRVEYRLGSRFVEITHEFLIVPILDAIRADRGSNVGYLRFLNAVRELPRFEGVDPTNAANLPGNSLFDTLRLNRLRVAWTRKLKDIMLRCAIMYETNKETIRVWAEEVDHGSDRSGLEEELLSEMRQRLEKGQSLSRSELKAVLKLHGTLEQTPELSKLVLRSLLERALDEDRDLIVTWYRRSL